MYIFLIDHAKPVYLMTVHAAHKEYHSLIDQIRAKLNLLQIGGTSNAQPV